MPPSDENPAALKHLGAVKGYGQLLGNVIQRSASTIVPIYESGVKLMPDFTKPYITTAEEKIRQVGAPVVVNAQDRAERMLKKADDHVDRVFINAQSFYRTGRDTLDSAVNNLREIHQQNVETYRQTTLKYFQLVGGTAEWVAGRVAPTPAFQKAHELLRVALNKAQQCADPDKAVKIVYDAWVVFAAVPVVAAVLPYVEPAVGKALQSFHALHNSLVVNPLYKQAYDLAAATLHWATTTATFRLGAQVVRPLVHPAAGVALRKITESHVANQVVDYWRPVAVA